MFTHDPYMVKAIEYLVGVSFLALFVVFWRFVNTGMEEAPAYARAWTGQLADWFRVPQELFFHPGHGWAKPDASGVLTIGMDDFAQHLVGPLASIDMPQPGAQVRRGAKGWTLRADSKSVDMLSPVTGTVVAVNRDVARHPDLANQDPYGRGWLMKIQVPGGRQSLADLISGAAARKWIAEVSNDLTAAMGPQLGTVMQDGGVPVHGLARSLDEAHWDDLARRFLATDRSATDRSATDYTDHTDHAGGM